MNEPIDLNAIINDVAQWPICPNCRQQSLIFGGQLATCCYCKFFGKVSEVAATDLLRFSRVKMALRGMGHRGVFATLAGSKDTEHRPRLVQERSSQIAQRLVHAPYVRKAQSYIEQHGHFAPTALTNFRPEEGHPVVSPMATPEDQRRFLFRVLNQDVASIIWDWDQASASFIWGRDGLETDHESLNPEQHRVLLVNTHIYNAPSHVRAIKFIRAGDRVTFAKEQILEMSPASLIYQPIDWEIITNRPGSIQPRWVAALEIERDVNFTFSVCENMDGAPLVRASVRTPWKNQFPMIKTYPVATAEEGVELLKGKYQKALERAKQPGVNRLVFSYEQEWEIDANPHLILFQLRNADLWKTYADIRKTK